MKLRTFRMVRAVTLARSIVRSHEGFNMIELMVAVGIAGGLAAIAVPQYSKYSSRARMGEAKIGLATLYSAQKSYGMEFNTYTACYGHLGYEPPQNRYYAIGYNSTIAVPSTCGAAGASTESCLGFQWEAGGAVATDGECGSGPNYDDPDPGAGHFSLGWNATVSAHPSGPAEIDLLWTGVGTPSITVGKKQFKIWAAGLISASEDAGGSILDHWSIDHNKVLIHERSGI